MATFRLSPAVNGSGSGQTSWEGPGARVWIGRDWDGALQGSVNLEIPDPDGIRPYNDLPDQPHQVLPFGRAIQVTGEELHMAAFTGFALGSTPRHVAATLHVIEEQKSERSALKHLVEVRLDGECVGVLTGQMSEQLRDLVSYVQGRGKTPVARAIVKGSSLRADVALYVARTVDVPQKWLDSI